MYPVSLTPSFIGNYGDKLLNSQLRKLQNKILLFMVGLYNIQFNRLWDKQILLCAELGDRKERKEIFS